MDSTPVRGTRDMVAGMAPALRDGEWVFVTGHLSEHIDDALMAFREDEGLTLVLPRERADVLALPYDLVQACLTLTVHSALDGVGLTAAVSGTLADAGIPCNMVAAYFHDHVFVPADRAAEALAVLRRLAHNAADAASR